MKVGWIGLGQIGEAFALKILEHGHHLVGHSRGNRRRERLKAAGAQITGSLTETVADADVVGVCLFDDEQVEEVLMSSGLLADMKPGTVLALHTTGSPSVVERLAADSPPGVDVLDATFSGSRDDAEAERIRLFIGGDAAALDRARPVLASYCDPIFHLGAIGAARRLKLINNLLFAAQVSLAAEALGAIEDMGLSIETAIDAIGMSSGGSYALNAFRGAKPQAIVDRVAHYMDKDVDAARAAAAEEGLDLHLLDAAAARWSLRKT